MSEDEQRPYNVWKDPIDGNEYDHPEMMKRMKTVHGIDADKAKGRKKLLCHIDGDTWYSSTYEWEIDGKIFIQNTRFNRTEDDLMYWRG